MATQLIAFGNTDSGNVDFTGPATIHIYATNGAVIPSDARVDLLKKNSNNSYTLVAMLGSGNAMLLGSVPAGTWAIRRRDGAACGVDKE